MACTHPVLYSRNCVLYCQICGAVLPPEKLAQKPEEPKRPPKKVSRKAKA